MGTCRKCMGRVPYGTVIATVLSGVGVLMFLICLYRAMQLTMRMIDDIFHYNWPWLNNIELAFIIVGTFMGILALALLVVGIFSTGATRTKIYRGWKSRIGGKVSSVLFMMIVYLLNIVWIVISCTLIVVVFVFYVCKNLCDAPTDCVDLRQFHFLFPNGTDVINRLNICSDKRKVFCTDTISYAEPYYILSFAASVAVLIGLIHYSMCLAANYTRIKDLEKFKDLQELQYLQDSEMGTLTKDRF